MENPLELGGYAVSFTTGFLQFLKQWKFFKNDWVRIAGPLVALAFLLSWYLLAQYGSVWVVQMLSVAFGTSITGEGFYNIQKPLGFLSKGPDNHPVDAANRWPTNIEREDSVSKTSS